MRFPCVVLLCVCVCAHVCACVSERAFCVYVHVSVCDVKMNLKMNGTTPLEYGAEFIKVNAAHAAYTSDRRGSDGGKRCVAIVPRRLIISVSGVCQARDEGEAQEALGS